ncbi:DUF6503 family protein [Winogradskyella thalassocola]|uniref:Aspartyl-tRNA synthetase n=1 Tax=Winogradskyella thalassocola TaxID=262004 RepID=A0A1G7VUD5_9FLAO|nr:DUF6503 family protein [Winogradskyella thalassocola]SDG63435.1 hypothetical protein SAMN04489796_101151 [Winogradskyella thalassocola]
MKSFFALLVCFISMPGFSQDISSQELLKNAIAYHDPNGNWPSFNDTFTFVMTMPTAPKRTSVISINLPAEYFKVTATKDTVTTTYILDKGKCQMQYNGKVLDSLKAKDKNMTCDRATLYKNYYSYLYGLPMKLKDAGTNLNDTVEKKTFKGKTYLVLKVTYDEAVGSDVWYFYFNPKTYAMEIYQFFKTDEHGKEKPDSGEYILLSEETLLNGIKITKVRAWYYNKADKYLGTDTLVEG